MSFDESFPRQRSTSTPGETKQGLRQTRWTLIINSSGKNKDWLVASQLKRVICIIQRSPTRHIRTRRYSTR